MIDIKSIPIGEISFRPRDDGTAMPWWNTKARTQHVLRAYPPHLNWGIRVRSDKSEVEMEHDGQYVPSYFITAQLVNPQGVVIAEAAALQGITDYKVYEAGDTAARSRLYDALGFPGDIEAALGVAIDPSDFAPRPEITSTNVSASNPTLRLVPKAASTAESQNVSDDAKPKPETGSPADEDSGNPLLVRDEQGGVKIVETPAVTKQRKVKAVPSRTPAAPSASASSPTEAKRDESLDGPCPAPLLQQVKSLAMMRSRKPAEILDRTKTKGEALSYIDELRGGAVNSTATA